MEKRTIHNTRIGDFLNDAVRQSNSTLTSNLKVYNDPVHGHIQLNPACQCIVDTPQFQRLRYLKQLGMVYYVYPGAAHNRFEHSLGTCYLAGVFVRILKQNQPFLGISDKDILCVEIAGLCHDLGHGILSHFFDQEFLPSVKEGKNDAKEKQETEEKEGTKETKETNIKHESISVRMFRHLINENRLMEDDGKLRNFGIDDDDIAFIEEQISGDSSYLEGEWKYKGRGKEKAYLYEIVSNKRNGIDVDKFDYFARDCHHLGFKNNFDYFRYMKFARVIEVDRQMQICIREKEMSNLYNMFYTRFTLHKKAYQHKVKCAIEAMVNDALIKANEFILFKGTSGEYRMSECSQDMEAFSQLTDNVLFKILYSPDPRLKESRDLIERIFKRDLYKTVYESYPVAADEMTTDKISKIQHEIITIAGESGKTLKPKDFVVGFANLDFGMKKNNPTERLNVYHKDDINNGTQLRSEHVSTILSPNKFSEKIIRVFSCTKDKATNDAIVCASKEWFDRNVTKFNQPSSSMHVSDNVVKND
ncbi:deoxynucleoside triphosphate triphosphohydrolase SAMHD1-like [Physella acuta]|uniref:deoxynucleoside triphosphate triphosphohydrolase SAMHD1-like n=1 Tax=Physella acuta TaxID=109671 RepID=UPI0027DE0603|nr:deoxynucleoside triphosphate triphosphohydrolase SAMHD1-like [Physella acuta]XP_059152304.1 deoxynucleoside triphosphate triphosphohydrolase SAMHD1-like [Physella acuta]XP_059152305.1 deoxynucleoside triphosphate triphosphohydrolase SAMHD1-like [Physella acuta]XP_059152306.1 deoxynucleoside triphosphate triphosphohydrolase SAMHD1-like [Physella acuta]XP_059152307.1 deoxynucleoside triphosphate triphosphohydrolase SAMHD1-like [Physella acuta]